MANLQRKFTRPTIPLPLGVSSNLCGLSQGTSENSIGSGLGPKPLLWAQFSQRSSYHSSREQKTGFSNKITWEMEEHVYLKPSDQQVANLAAHLSGQSPTQQQQLATCSHHDHGRPTGPA